MLYESIMLFHWQLLTLTA